MGESHYDDCETYATTYWIMKFLTGGSDRTYPHIEQSITGSPNSRNFDFWKTIAYLNFVQEPLQFPQRPTQQQIAGGLPAFRAALDCPKTPQLLLVFSDLVWKAVESEGVAGPTPRIQIADRPCEMRIFTATSGAKIYAGRIDHPSYWKYIKVDSNDWHQLINEYISIAHLAVSA
jgi:hypothetical protein